MFSIFSCFRQKTPPTTLGPWLEEAFPGKFEVLDSNLKMLDVMAQFKGEKQALVADKSDQTVQFLLDWSKNTPNLGLDKAAILAKHSQAQQEVEQSRALFNALKAKGLARFSAAALQQAAYVLVFAEPKPELRSHVLGLVLDFLDEQADPAQTSIFIEFMEPGVYQAYFQDIIPRGDWLVEAGHLRENKIISLDFEYKKGLKLATMQPRWALNPESTRALEFHKLAFEQARIWAEQHVRKPYFMSDDGPLGFEAVDDEAPGIRYGFPYFRKKPAAGTDEDSLEPAGYVVGVYHFDQQAFVGIREQKEF